MDVVERVLSHAAAAPAHLAGGRLICIDGPAGSGKTTLAAAIVEAAPETVVLHMDDLYDGWGGLAAGTGHRLLEDVVAPLAAGEPGHYRRYDWHLERFAELHLVPSSDLLVLEGVGSGDRTLAAYRSTLVWVEAPERLRHRRGLERDRDLVTAQSLDWDEDRYLAKWRRFVADEERFFAEHRVRAAADVIVDGAGRESL